MNAEQLQAVFDTWCKKLRLTPAWDIRLELVDDPDFHKTGDFKVDCDDRKAVLLLNIRNPRQENPEEVIVHELMHLKMYPLDQVTESLVLAAFPQECAQQDFAYTQFFTTLEQTVEELTKCFLLEYGENRELSFGRCKGMKSFDDLYQGLKSIWPPVD